jgi:hypothetical protein
VNATLPAFGVTLPLAAPPTTVTVRVSSALAPSVDTKLPGPSARNTGSVATQAVSATWAQSGEAATAR